jgi:ankyrin repeat protein
MLPQSEVYALFEQSKTGQLSVKSIDPVQASFMRDEEGRSLLDVAVLSKHRDTVKDYFVHVDITVGDAQRALCCAAQTGDAELFQEVYDLARGVVNGLCKNAAIFKEKWGYICDRALEDACDRGFSDIVRIILNHGEHAYYGNSLRGAWVHGHLDVVDMLIEAGENVHDDPSGRFLTDVLEQSRALLGNSLDEETRRKLINHLIDRGAGSGSIGEEDRNRIAPRWACVPLFGTAEISRYVVGLGYITAENIEVSLENACSSSNKETFRCFLGFALEQRYTIDADMLFDVALQNGSGDIAELLLERSPVNLSWTGRLKHSLKMKFVLSAMGGSVVVVKKFLEKVDGNVNCVAERRPDLSFRAPCTALSRASDPAVIRFLLDAKADVNPKRCDTVLRGACRKLRPDAVKMLLAAGATVSGTGKMGAASALYDAVYAECTNDGVNDKVEVINLLLRAGVNTRDCGGGKSVLHIPDLDHNSSYNLAAAFAVLSAHDPGLVHARDAKGATPLVRVCTHDYVDIGVAKMLLEAKSDVAAVDRCDNTALSPLLQQYRWSRDGMHAWRCLRLLLDAGADPTVCGRGETVLMRLVNLPSGFRRGIGESDFYGAPAVLAEIINAVLHRPVTSPDGCLVAFAIEI